MSEDAGALPWREIDSGPRITAAPPGERGQAGEKSRLYLKKADIRVIIHGPLVETETTLVFHNPFDRDLSGDLEFPLPENALLTGYALDIGGAMIDGVVVEKQKGRQVYESIVRQGIDPGLVEATRGNNFKTRVFPLPAGGERTIRIRYMGDVETDEAGPFYHLPLGFSEKLDRLSIRVEAVGMVEPPAVRPGAPVQLKFDREGERYAGRADVIGRPLSGDLRIGLPRVAANTALIERGPDGEAWFRVDDFPQIPEAEPRPDPERLTVLWDVSGSRGQTGHEREIGLLTAYFASIPEADVRVELATFSNAVHERKRFRAAGGEAGDLIAAIEALDYDGGTRPGCIAPGPDPSDPDFFLLFTDGLFNFGSQSPGPFNRPVFVFSADPRADHAALRHMARQTGGEYFNLNRITVERAAPAVGRPVFGFLSAEAAEGEVRDLEPGAALAGGGRFSMTGRLVSDKARVVLRYGWGGRELARSGISLEKSTAIEGRQVRLDWARMRLERLKLDPKKNESEITFLGKRFNLVTPGTSLIVLDSLDQYLEHDIEPPESLPEMRRAWFEEMGRRGKVAQEVLEDRVWYLRELWEKRVAWWEQEFKYPEGYRFEEARKERRAAASRPTDDEYIEDELDLNFDEAADGISYMMVDDPPEAEAPSPVSDGVEDLSDLIGGPDVYFSMADEEAEPDEEVEAEAPAPSAKSGPEPAPSIRIQEWDPATPYLEALKEADPEAWWETYLKARAEFGESPAFFLDCSDFFQNRERPETALRVLTNIAELKLEDAALLRILGYRLEQRGLLDESISVFEEVLSLRPEEPQSWRDLALVLGRRAGEAGDPEAVRADYARSLKLLAHVIMNPWVRGNEIEVVALMEINRLIPRARAAGVTDIPLPEELIRLLDVDLRVVLTWDADETDVDLWVIEPSGEKAYYSHPRTAIGGLVSRDVTNGYGPEEYVLRRAMPGEYTIAANYYGSRAVTLIGAVTVQATVFTNFGREGETHQSLTLRLTEAKETQIVGAVTFGSKVGRGPEM